MLIVGATSCHHTTKYHTLTCFYHKHFVFIPQYGEVKYIFNYQTPQIKSAREETQEHFQVFSLNTTMFRWRQYEPRIPVYLRLKRSYSISHPKSGHITPRLNGALSGERRGNSQHGRPVANSERSTALASSNISANNSIISLQIWNCVWRYGVITWALKSANY